MKDLMETIDGYIGGIRVGNFKRIGRWRFIESLYVEAYARSY